MRFWLTALGGLTIWAVHFLGLYVLASVADVAWRDAAGGRAAGLVFSLACLACLAAVALAGLSAARGLRRPPSDETRLFGLRMGVAGAVVAGVGVMFQTAPLLVV